MGKTLKGGIHETCVAKITKTRSVTLALSRDSRAVVIIIVIGRIEKWAIITMSIHLHSIE
jgi:hypothetical protein